MTPDAPPADAAPDPGTPRLPASLPAPDDLEIELLEDGRVSVHVRCLAGRDSEACAALARLFTEALGDAPPGTSVVPQERAP